MMPQRRLIPAVLLLTAGLFAFGCATPQSHPPGEGATHEEVANANLRSVEIVYVLGHDLHRFFATSDATLHENSATAKYTEGHQVLAETKLDPKHYADFHEKALAFVTALRRNVASLPGKPDKCRNTFTVTVKDGAKLWTESGCRSTDDGAFSRLVRDEQFLLYSKK